jgi:hypothetical protein
MLKPVSIEGWAVIVCMGDRDLRGQGMGSLDNFIGAIITGFSSMAMGITRDPVVQWGADMGRYPDPATFSDSVTQMLKSASGMNKKIDVVFVIIPKKGALCLDSRNPVCGEPILKSWVAFFDIVVLGTGTCVPIHVAVTPGESVMQR